MYPERGPEPRLLHSLSLSVLKELHSRKKRPVPQADNREDNGGAVGHSVDSLPPNTCTLSAFGGGGRVQLLGWPSGGTGAEKGGLQSVEPAEKTTSSWVLVLDFSPAPQAPVHASDPGP